MIMVYHGILWESMENFRKLLTVLCLFFLFWANALENEGEFR